VVDQLSLQEACFSPYRDTRSWGEFPSKNRSWCGPATQHRAPAERLPSVHLMQTSQNGYRGYVFSSVGSTVTGCPNHIQNLVNSGLRGAPQVALPAERDPNITMATAILILEQVP